MERIPDPPAFARRRPERHRLIRPHVRGRLRARRGSRVEHARISSHPPPAERLWRPSNGSARESSVFHFQATGNPPHHYQITFKGKGLWRDRGKIKFLHTHRVEIKLGASYPRTIPEIRWLTPIYHPISPRSAWSAWGIRHPLGAQRPARRALHDALGHGPVPQLRHPEPLQPRCRALGGQPDDVPVPDRPPAAARPAGGPGADRGDERGHEWFQAIRRARIRHGQGKSGDRPPATVARPRKRPGLSSAVDRVRQFLERYGRDLRRELRRRVERRRPPSAGRATPSRPRPGPQRRSPRFIPATPSDRSAAPAAVDRPGRPGRAAAGRDEDLIILEETIGARRPTSRRRLPCRVARTSSSSIERARQVAAGDPDDGTATTSRSATQPGRSPADSTRPAGLPRAAAAPPDRSTTIATAGSASSPGGGRSGCAAARILVVGAGALGNEVIKNLALVGVGTTYLIDLDVVEPSNLSRSVLFRAEDGGQAQGAWWPPRGPAS